MTKQDKVNIDDFEWFPKLRDWEKDMENYKAYTRSEQKKALEYWLQETKQLCELNQQKQREILSLRIQVKAERERADKLKEEVETDIQLLSSAGMHSRAARLDALIDELYPESEEIK